MPILRPETPADLPAIWEVNRQAFERPNEAGLVDALRGRYEPFISLVAEIDGTVAGHILFTPVQVRADEGRDFHLLSLAPMAVLPAHQGQGLGSALVHRGLELCRESAYPAVVVLGHPGFYPRFGFRPARPQGIRPPYPDLPDEVFMLLELQPGGLAGRTGTVIYPPEFESVDS